ARRYARSHLRPDGDADAARSRSRQPGRTGDRPDAGLYPDGRDARRTAGRPVPGPAVSEPVSAIALSPPVSRPHWRRLAGPILLFVALALVPLAAKLGTESYILSLMTRVLALALAAMSLDLLIGVGGLVSFGHAAFIGIGTYAVGILAAEGVTDGFAQMGVAL